MSSGLKLVSKGKIQKLPRCTSQEDGLRLQEHCQSQRVILHLPFSKTLDTLSKLGGLGDRMSTPSSSHLDMNKNYKSMDH